MRLELLDYRLDDIQWGARTLLQGDTLFLHPADVQNEIKDLVRSVGIRMELARPGESKRIIHVLDTILPLEKTDSTVCAFPGFEPPTGLVGTGRTVRLRNLLVTLAGLFPHPEMMTPLERPREGIIDMSGPGAPYSYGSNLFHLVLTLEPGAAVSNIAFDQTLRAVGLHLARWLARIEKIDAQPVRHTSELFKPDKELPKVVLIYQVQSQIPFVRTFYYGEEVSRTLAAFVHPNEFFDGAITSGNYKSERKIPTSLHCANPFIEELIHRHGKEVDFLGVILSKGYNDSFEQKQKMGLWCGRLARNLGAERVVAVMEGTGNTTVDFMQTVKACETEGIRTVAVLHEDDGPRGYERPLVDHPPEADAMISRGNRSEKFILRPLQTVIGGNSLDLHLKATQDPRQLFLFDPTIYFASHCQMGMSRMRAAYEM